jgi:integrase
MGGWLLVQCPECKRRNGGKEKVCKQCGFQLAKFSRRVYWIEYRDQDNRLRRERIGSNKLAAEHRLRDVESALVEGRYIKKSPDACTLFRTLADWYLELPEVKAKRSYDRDCRSLKLLLPFFGDLLLKDIIPAQVEAYKQKRLAEPSGRTPQYLTKPATVNRELACLKTIFNKAVMNGKAEKNPVQRIKLLKENNERDRILSREEYDRLCLFSPTYLKPIVKVAYQTGMRQGEILNLVWERVDLKEKFIRLRPEDTKTNEARLVPLNKELVEMFLAMPRGLPGVRVFTRNGLPIKSIRMIFEAACREAKIEEFTFHDLRHTAINNWRLQGHDYFRIMAVTGHKTMNVFKRYNTVSREELQAMVE